MTEWYKSAFGEDYLSLYAHRNAEEAAQLAELIQSVTGAGAGARVLDAPCGAGRHMRAFEEAGLRAFGFDLSTELLADAAKNGTRRGTFVRGDLRAIPFKTGSFDLVVNLFSSLGYFEEDPVNVAVLCTLVSLCRPGGWLVVDFMNSSYLHEHLEPESVREMTGGLRVHDRRWIAGTPPRVNKTTTITAADGTEKVLQESVRLFTPEELRTHLERCGLAIEREFGDYQGNAFGADSRRIIIAGRRR